MVTFLLQAQTAQPDHLGRGLAEYGALGVLILALIWLLQLVLTKLPAIIENNTAALTSLSKSLEGKINDCPFRDSVHEELKDLLKNWRERGT